jgi:hypothetical protein
MQPKEQPVICSWCDCPIREQDTSEMIQVNDQSFRVHDYCAATVIGIYADQGKKIQISDLNRIT